MAGVLSPGRGIKWRLYFLYWLAYVLLFSVIQGVPAKSFMVSFYNELLSLAPKIIFVLITVEWLMDRLLFKKKTAAFITFYITLLVVFAAVMRGIDNYIILKYLLTTWVKEPLFSAPPFLYNVIKLQFVVTVPFSVKLFYYLASEQSKVSLISSEKMEIERRVNALQANTVNDPGSLFILIKCDRKLVKLFLNEIFYLEAQRNYLLIYTATEVYKTYQSITEMLEKLPANRFVRIHRSFVVALDKVGAYTNSYAEVKQKEIPIGRLYSAGLAGVFQSGPNQPKQKKPAEASSL
ncbi:hypothetical protein BH09BAC6_BH09BAC6_35520 [soil metagenome]